MMQIAEKIEEFNAISIVIRLVLATICGGIIGLERETKRHSAGFRTFTLVCIGSALATIVNIYLWEKTASADTSRIAAGVVNGVGFLGVGTIIVTRKNLVKGLTTAAGLWTTATLGIAIGSGMIFVSVVSFILVMLTMSVLSHFSRYIGQHNKRISLYLEIKEEYGMKPLLAYVRANGYSILTMEKQHDSVTNESDISVMLEIDMKKRILHEKIIHEISEIEGIIYLEELTY